MRRISKSLLPTTVLSLAIVAALSACKPGDKPAQAAGDARADAAPELTLDESKLPPVNRFAIGDLDTSKNACGDFGGYVNGKWLAANAIPGDRTSWGAFEMLDERSDSAQLQLAQQAAADAKADGVKKIVGDFWATGL
jgi:putative endopeptidase